MPMGLNLAGMGSFHVGGRVVELRGQAVKTGAFTRSATLTWDPNGHYFAEQAYVQWFRPARQATARGLLFVHGGGLSGAMWETTPDGRPGWLELFLRRGFPVFVIDNAERGRAGWCPLPGVFQGEAILRSAEWAWTLFRFGLAEDFVARRVFPGQRFPVAHLDDFVRSFVPRWLSTTDAQVAALGAAIRRIGPVDLVCHSQGGEVAFRAAAEAPDLVRAVVAIEPSGFSEGLDPARQRVLTVLGDYWDASPEDVAREQRIQAFADRFRSRGAVSEVWDMAARGRPGHSHMLMMDAGNDSLANEIADWLLA